MEILGQEKPRDTSTGAGLTSNLTPFGGAINSAQNATHSFEKSVVNHMPITALKGFYVISFKTNKDEKRNLYTVTNHINIDKFIQDMLQFGVLTFDVKIIEKTDDYLDAISRMNMLVCEEGHLDTRGMKYRAFMNKEIVSWKRLFGFEPNKKP